MAKCSAALLLLLATQQTVAYRITHAEAEERHSLIQTDEDSERILWCSSFCVPCADGKRSVLVSRERGMDKYVEGLATAGVIAGAVFQPWILAGLPALGALKTYTDTLHNECPNIKIVYFDKTEGEPEVKQLEDDRLKAMLSKDEYLQLWQKNTDRVFIAEKAAKEGRDVNWHESMFTGFSNRSHGQLPDSLFAYASNSELFCEDYGEGVANVTEESFGEVSQRAVGWQTFAKSCEELVAPPPSRCCCKKEAESDTPQCKLLKGDELKTSINPTKWGAFVCPSEQGYHHYERYDLEGLPEGCAE